MDWKADCKYRLRGQYHGIGDEQMMIFDLEEPEIIVHERAEQNTEETPETASVESLEESETEPTSEPEAKSVRTTYFPKNWVSSFGRKTDEIIFLKRVKYYGNWDVLRPAKTIEGMDIITQDVLEDLSKEAQALMDGMRSAV
jgi:phage terminase large subunit GpA-like protein